MDEREPPWVEVTIEIPRGGHVKRGAGEVVAFVSPLPCPFNYGSVHAYVGGDGDLLDALVLGPRLPRGTRVRVPAHGAVGFLDRDVHDDKLVCSARPLRAVDRLLVVAFFHVYAAAKRAFNWARRGGGRTACEGWGDAHAAIARAHRRDGGWRGPTVPY